MQNILDNLKKYLEGNGKTITWLEAECSFSKGTLSKALKNNTSIGSDKIIKILEVLPKLNLRWWLLNTGDMELEEVLDDTGVNFKDKAEYYNFALNKLRNEFDLYKRETEIKIAELETIKKYLEGQLQLNK